MPADFFTKENVTFFLSVLGSLGALYTLISGLIRQHCRINISIIEYVPANNSVILYMMLVNRSHLPVSITDIKIWNRGVIYACEKSPHIVQLVTRKTGETIIYKEAIYSVPFPINLPALSGTSGYLYFEIPQENFECASKSLTVQVNTSRNQKFQKTLLLPENLQTAK